MIAVDTNVVLRVILGDDEDQAAAIARLMEQTLVFVPLTVLVEVGWVLESRYRFPRERVADAIDGLLALAGIEVARARLVEWAVERYRTGADWADVVHVIAAAKLDGFATLDRDLSRQVGDAAPTMVKLIA